MGETVKERLGYLSSATFELSDQLNTIMRQVTEERQKLEEAEPDFKYSMNLGDARKDLMGKATDYMTTANSKVESAMYSLDQAINALLDVIKLDTLA